MASPDSTQSPESTPETGPLGQCVYTMSTGRRCQKDAAQAIKFDTWSNAEPKAYGYCHDHAWAITKPRDPRIHKTAEPLIRVEKEPVIAAESGGATT